MDLNYKPGQTLYVELSTNEVFIGKLILASKNYIKLDYVYDIENKEYLDGDQVFYVSDIISIKVYKNSDIKDEATSLSSNDIGENTIESNDKKNDDDHDDNDKDIPGLTLDELKEIENNAHNAIYIYQTDRLYHDSIKDIIKQDSIVISIESCKMGRHTNADLITIKTQNKIYIFDITYLGKIHLELKNILESKKIKKILHDGRKIADNLKFQHNIDITSIFDTLVAHVLVSGERHKTELNECIYKYLNITKSFFYYDKDTNWHERPLDDNRKLIAAKKVIFIYKLYTILLHKHLLKGFYKACNNFANIYKQNSDSVEVACDMVSSNQSSINTIDDADLELSNSIDSLNLQDLS